MEQHLAHGLSKTGFSAAWEKVREVFLPEARRRREEVEKLLGKGDTDKSKWDQMVALATESPEFIRQLGRQKKVDPKLIVHVKSMREMNLGDTVAQVDSASSPGRKYEVKQLESGGFGCTCNDWRYKGSVNPSYECKHIRAFKQGKIKVANARIVETGLLGAQSVPSFNLVKLGEFSEQTDAFFNELSKIRKKQIEDRDEGAHNGPGQIGGERPFSSILTQDEEPSDYRSLPDQGIDDPEIILGGSR